ncbi:hypothetical protein RU94_GL001830 [Enterococcus asini]|nr:hypothetical protein RU94_GL001830 [Enterococcus asini]
MREKIPHSTKYHYHLLLYHIFSENSTIPEGISRLSGLF